MEGCPLKGHLLDRPAKKWFIRPVCGQPLVMKCRAEPTVSGWGKSNSSSTSLSNGGVDLEVTLIEGRVE